MIWKIHLNRLYIYGKSTSNKIERWWKELHECMEKYIKWQLNSLLQSHSYDPSCSSDRKIMSYVFIPVLQRECGVFSRLWNSHRVRYEKGLELPTGIPNHTSPGVGQILWAKIFIKLILRPEYPYTISMHQKKIPYCPKWGYLIFGHFSKWQHVP